MVDSPRIGIAGDDTAHRLLIKTLAEAAVGPSRRLDFVGDGQGRPMLKAKNRRPEVTRRYRSQRVEGRPLGQAAVMAECVEFLAPNVDIAVVLVDEDGKGDRTQEVDDATRFLAGRVPCSFVLGVCNPIAEAWVIALSGPPSEGVAREVRRYLQIDPWRHPEKLSAGPDHSPRHAKRVFHFIADNARRRPEDYPIDTPNEPAFEAALAGAEPSRIPTFKGCGLSDFHDRMKAVLSP